MGTLADKAFEDLKTAFTTTPILIHPDFAKAFYLETNASDFALEAILLQMDVDKKFHPVAFYSRKFFAIEINYEIHDKELLAIVDSFQEWHHFLEGAVHSVTIYTDHKNLEYFIMARVLNHRQARWNMSLSRFDFVITYRPRKQQELSDTLPRRSYFVPKIREFAFDQQCTTLLKPEQFKICVVVVPIDVDFFDQVCATTIEDFIALDIKQHVNNDKFKVEEELLYFEEQLYIPEGPTQLRVLQSCHDFSAMRHSGFNKTLELVSRDFWWPQMWKDVKEFVFSCDICSRCKNPWHRPYGLLQPLPIPRRQWSLISMYFITDMPPSNSFDNIFIVVDWLTKMAHFIPCKKTSTSKDTVWLFFNTMYQYHGLPDDIVSDRGTQFVSKFWRSLFAILNVDNKLSSVFHPQTNGQTECSVDHYMQIRLIVDM